MEFAISSRCLQPPVAAVDGKRYDGSYHRTEYRT